MEQISRFLRRGRTTGLILRFVLVCCPEVPEELGCFVRIRIGVVLTIAIDIPLGDESTGQRIAVFAPLSQHVGVVNVVRRI